MGWRGRGRGGRGGDEGCGVGWSVGYGDLVV